MNRYGENDDDLLPDGRGNTAIREQNNPAGYSQYSHSSLGVISALLHNRVELEKKKKNWMSATPSTIKSPENFMHPTERTHPAAERLPLAEHSTLNEHASPSPRRLKT